MIDLKVGKLYKTEKYYLLVYPTDEAASSSPNKYRPPIAAKATDSIDAAIEWARFWSNGLNCNVRFLKPGEPFMLVGQKQISDETFLKVLTDKFGWFVWKEKLEIHEISQ